jgi:hypothetical protein
MLRFINPCNCRDFRRSAPITPCNSTALLRIRVCRKASKKRAPLRRYEFTNTPVQFIRLEAGLAQSRENVYIRQKALTRRAKSTIQAPDWAATIAFSLASTIAESIRKAGKPAMEFSDFSRHRSFQSTALPMLLNNLEPAILRRSAGRNFQVTGARLTCVFLPPHGKQRNWRRVSKRPSIGVGARGSTHLSTRTRATPGFAGVKIRPRTSDVAPRNSGAHLEARRPP